MSTAAMMGKVAVVPRPPDGLSLRAVKVAHRLEQLPPDRAYHITLVKEHDRWILAVHEPAGVKVESIT